MLLNAINANSIRAKVLAALCMVLASVLSPIAGAHEGDGAERHSVSYMLPNVPGKTITATVVSYLPGGKSPAHRHAGSVMAYVLSGSIRSENSATGAVRIYRAGETFFEPPESTHLVSENASEIELASLLAIFIADTDAVLTLPAR